MLSSHLLTWQLFWASWRKDFKTQDEVVSKLEGYFKKVPLVPNLIWNVISAGLFLLCRIRYAGCSDDLFRFILSFMVTPMLVGSFGYFHYRFGALDYALIKTTLESFVPWVNNMLVMLSISMVVWIHLFIIYVAGCLVEPWLPSGMQYSMAFPMAFYEDSFKLSIYWHWGLFVVLGMAVPLWTQGYKLCMQVAGRNTTMTWKETLGEMLYLTSISSNQIVGPGLTFLIMQYRWGLRVHLVHLIMAMVEVVFLDYSAMFKFSILHQLEHEIQPLYQLAHIEHHICKGIHPTGNPAGLWEGVFVAEGVTFTLFFLAAIPNLYLQTAYVGANMLVHVMWPWPKFLQYHTLHHTVSADVYAVNIPSAKDMDASKTVAQLHDKLCEVSPFCRIECLSDVVGAIMMVLFGFFFHYGLGVGLTKMDWSQVEWTFSPLYELKV